MQTQRLASIDLFRGFAILLMVLANFSGGIKTIPAWLKHAPDIGLTVVDFIAPFFIFAIGLTYGASFRRRRERDGAGKTYNRFLVRYLAILGMGAIISAGETALGFNSSGIDWGVLQAIGVAGLITLVVIGLPSHWRWGIGLGLLVSYQWVLDQFLLDLTLRSPHGGLFGSVAWAAMLILATALADLFHKDSRRQMAFPGVSLLILALGIGLTVLTPISKHRVSLPYVLITLGSSALLFGLFHWLTEHLHLKASFLVMWGRNPLVLYFLHYLLIGVILIPGIPDLYAEASVGWILLEMASLIGGISAAAYGLDRLNLVIHV